MYRKLRMFVLLGIFLGFTVMNPLYSQEMNSGEQPEEAVEESVDADKIEATSDDPEAIDSDSEKKQTQFNHGFTTDVLQLIALVPTLKYEFIINKSYGIGLYLAGDFNYFFDIGLNFSYYFVDYGFGKLCVEGGIIFSTETGQPLETPLLFSAGTRVRLPFLPGLIVKPTFGVLIPLNGESVAPVLQINLGYEF